MAVENNEQYASGSGIIQIGGDVHITVHTSGAKPAKKMLTREQRQRISVLAAEVESAEKQFVSQRRIRYFLNEELGIKTVDEMTDDMFRKAVTYLAGWKACAAGEYQGEAAMVAQVIRIWTIATSAQPMVTKFARDNFGTSRMNDLSYWQMRCTLAFAMQCWTTYWESRKDV